jgi:hypothetical protein
MPRATSSPAVILASEQFVYSQAVPETIATYVRALRKMARGKKKLRR